MFNRKFLNMLVSLMVLTTLVFGGNFKAAAMPMGPVDETKVPHYFGPNPNWANSPFRVPDIAVTLTSLDTGTGATAAATVDPQTGAVTGISVLTPGSGYTVAPNVVISGAGTTAGTPAAATAVIDNSGILTAVTVTAGGNGYTAPVVNFTGGTLGSAATATAYGSVDAVNVTGAGSGYTFATVEFGLPDGPNGVQATGHATMNASGGVTSVVVDNPGSGYSKPPKVTIHDCTVETPCNTGSGATATATLAIQSIVLNTFGAGYTSAPVVDITDLTGTGAAASAAFSAAGSVVGFTVTNPGSGYMTPGIKKFVDGLPGLCDPKVANSCPDWKTNPTAKAIPLGVPEAKKYPLNPLPGETQIEADEYVIGLVQYRTSFSSSLPDTLVRGYVQIDTGNIPGSQHVPLMNELRDGTLVDTGYFGVTPPQFLGPTLAATKDKPVRIVFRNLLPTGSEGDLFIPTDSSMMGSGMGPMNMMAPTDEASVMDMVRNPSCSDYSKGDGCFKDNRATLHLHGGTTPWISDGTAHQWITPANQSTPWPQGVSVSNVPDMGAAGCDGARDGCMTFYYTNQQSARLLFYHDHAWGITRLNVYAGEAAGYLISDPTEQGLISSGTIPTDQIPLIVQDRTFVPQDSQLYNVYNADGSVKSYGQDPTWDKSRWGSYGDFWYHHVYMPAQNPGDPSGMSAYGRWMYGPWFWPPATPPYGPIPNPYYNMDPKANPPFSQPLTTPCNLDDPTTWQYQTDPFCEPQYIPGTPNISVGMEQFNDTPIVNGVAYPTITLEPKSYRLRMLNAANDRFFNFQWYVADPTTASADLNNLGQPIGGTEVAFKAAELAAAQTDPNVFPTPDTAISKPGPDWIQIGSEGGFLPAPTVIDGQQVTTWITDPTRFDVGNVDQHSLTLAPAERADVIVDFSQFAGKTLILYNDAPAAFPARVPSYDYYTGAPDLSPNGAPNIPPGYGPNTRTVMQVKIAGNTASAFDLGKLQATFTHKADGSGVFESGQHPIIVGQAAYNSAYGTHFAAGSNCNASNSTTQSCDGYVRINDTSAFGFNTLLSQNAKFTMPLQPKAIHDEMNASSFDEFGRMTANLGVEAQPPTPGAQNVTLYPFVNPATEIIDATNLPKQDVAYDANGLPVNDIKFAPISDPNDGTQIWRITHNGVDTHPIHFHLYDVQVINRVTWDNIIIAPDANELGWKDTVRISPLEDTIVALRPIIPEVPWELPNAIRPLNPMMPIGDTAMFNNVDPQGNPTNPIINQLVNFGWEYVYHCHILSHEEMDMMRPVSVVLPPKAPGTLTSAITGSGNNARIVLSWMDNSIAETEYVIQSMTWPNTWVDVGRIVSPLSSANTTGIKTFTVPGTYNANAAYRFRVVAQNTVGYGLEFPTMTAKSISNEVSQGTIPAAPTTLTATLQAGPQVRLTWRDNATNEAGFVIERSDNGGAFVQIATAPARNSTGNVTFTDTTVRAQTEAQTYAYRVAASNVAGNSLYSNTVSVTVGTVVAPAAPTALTASLQAGPVVSLTWTDNAVNETGFVIQRSTTGNGGPFTQIGTASALSGTGTVTFNDTAVQPTAAGATYTYRVVATNAGGNSGFSNTASVTEPALPAAPSNFGIVNGPNRNKQRTVILTWADNSTNETGFTIERGTNALFTQGLTTTNVAANVTTLTQTGLSQNTQYWFRIRANNGNIIFTAWVNATPFPITTNP